jgi:hypothetical protein
MNVDDWNCRVDMCSITGKFGIYVVPDVQV